MSCIAVVQYLPPSPFRSVDVPGLDFFLGVTFDHASPLFLLSCVVIYIHINMTEVIFLR